MIEKNILKLSEQPGRSLDRLETKIWSGVEDRLREKSATRTLLSCQAVIFAMALVGSIAAGAHATAVDDPSPGLDVFSTRADLAPSTRLIGH
jgi:hypothetical protein